MFNPRLTTFFSYLFVGALSIVLAVYLASQFVKKSYSQSENVENVSSEETQNENVQDTNDAAPQTEDAVQVNNGPVANEQGLASAISTNVTFLEPYIFDVREGRRNPFKAPQIVDGAMADAVFPGTPLERYELDELKLAGIMWDIKAPKAMVIDPQGEVHVLGKDDRIGKKRGYIAAIREGELVVVETTTFNGENTFTPRIIRIEK